MARPKAIVTAKIDSNMELIAHAQARDAEMATIQRAAAELFHQLGVIRSGEHQFIDRCIAENRALEMGSTLVAA